MELYTLDRKFIRQMPIDTFDSAIWTERYYGNGDLTLVVPADPGYLQALIPGTFIAEEDSNEVMLLETYDIKDGALKVTGQSLLPFLNNRIIRVTAAHEDQYWTIQGQTPGQMLWDIVYYMCVAGSPYLIPAGSPMGIANADRLAIPGLGGGSMDFSGTPTTIAIPYGPVYDALTSIATTDQMGMKIILDHADANGYSLLFTTHRGLDRTSAQTVNPTVRFSPQFDSLTGIEELQSMTSYKNLAYSFAPSNPNGLAGAPGADDATGASTGFDLRATMTFENDITTDQVGNDPNVLLSILNSRALAAVNNAKFVKTVDGEITPLSQFQYGVHYNMGDIVEMQGNSGTVQRARITEFIRSQDNTGERSYPTVAVID